MWIPIGIYFFLVISLSLQLRFRPFEYRRDNWLDAALTVIASLTYFASILTALVNDHAGHYLIADHVTDGLVWINAFTKMILAILLLRLMWRRLFRRDRGGGGGGGADDDADIVNGVVHHPTTKISHNAKHVPVGGGDFDDVLSLAQRYPTASFERF